MENLKHVNVSVEKIIEEKLPHKKLPKFIVNYLKRIIHEDEVNLFFERYPDAYGIDFAKSVLEFVDITISVYGLENLPHGGKYIFASNHPLGGLDGIALAYYIGKEYDGKIRLLVNDFLMYLKPFSQLLIPINKVGAQGKNNLKKIADFYASDNHLITFPAGACSRKIKGQITDLEWKKHFIVKSVEYQRDVVPIFFEGRNSNFFYNLSNIRKFLGVKLNIEMLYLADELFKQRGNHFSIYIGKPIPWQTFDSTKSYSQWAEWVKEEVYLVKQ